MKPLNVRFKSETSELIDKLAEKHSETSSRVARDAMRIGLGIMTSSGVYVSPNDFFKDPKDLEEQK